MISECFTLDAMKEQALALRAKNARPGFDNMTPDAALVWLNVNGDKLLKDIRAGHYRPMPALGFTTAKLNGQFRQLAKLTMIDSILQSCILHSLTPVFEGLFSPSSFAYRPGRGVSAALSSYCANAMEYAYCAKLDIASCFDSIEPAILENKLNEYLTNHQDLIPLIMLMVHMPLLS